MEVLNGAPCTICVPLHSFCKCSRSIRIPAEPSHTNRERTAWIAGALNAMQTIKVGVTRSDLIKVFTTEGGPSTIGQFTLSPDYSSYDSGRQKSRTTVSAQCSPTQHESLFPACCYCLVKAPCHGKTATTLVLNRPGVIVACIRMDCVGLVEKECDNYTAHQLRLLEMDEMASVRNVKDLKV